jgi:site-specific recombinase XerD
MVIQKRLKDTTMTLNKRYLTDDEQRRILAVTKGQGGLLAQRDHAWIRLLIETGMRISELATLTARQAESALANGWLAVTKEQRKGKRKGHEYLVTEPVRQCLEKLIALQAELHPALNLPVDVVPPLLWGRCGVVGSHVLCEHMSVRSFQARMKHWSGLAGLPEGVSPHWLRHTRGVNIIRRSRGNNPLKVAQLALGHASIASTGIYTQMSREEYEQELRCVAGGRIPKAAARALGAGGGL